ncbi:MAG TPA: DEAD/DEAH box helicase family protein, partial [Gammaproteobacteria bacterium]|nr:DEAD/DEAH box helicase family protein [Gammaproteobacteria bacterium]
MAAVSASPLRLAPRPYQDEAVAAVLHGAQHGLKRPLIALPTGTGKTIVFALLIQQRPGRALVLAHRDELIEQAVEKLHWIDPEMEIGVVKAERDEHEASVVVASVQTLSRCQRLARLVPDFDTIVIDEAHHA